MKSGNLRPEPPRTAFPEKAPVKLEIVEDSLEEKHGPPSKRSKPSPNLQLWNSKFNPLDEPRPLGLTLRKSPSLLDLIQMRLSQSQTSGSSSQAEVLSSGAKKEAKHAADKLKASNFPASILRIGNWKHKLVWEVLEGALKSKIEIQWSDIMAIKANCPDDGPGTLNVVLARRPLFFRETNLQPRKTHLMAGNFRFYRCRQPEIVLDSPYFESQALPFEDPDEMRGHDVRQGETGKGSSTYGFQNGPRSPSSVTDSCATEGSGSCDTVGSKQPMNLDQIKVPGLHPYISMNDLMNDIEQYLSEKDGTTVANSQAKGETVTDLMEEISS
ncbi:50S ribosomal protein L35 isoform 1 [Hibiscus syriacus]|uniref:50S ribosomal protein L35 isoform 1 n=1 Tax=Hibiscus syriacus TaxID=106335 RepID=A0A6A3D1I1_HIBSY|nr:50S ribosomal protein L35 isoform 1 [Hibiscus syriacus]